MPGGVLSFLLADLAGSKLWSVHWRIDLERISDWMAALDEDSYQQVIAAVELLRQDGPHLGRPLVDTVERSAHSNMKELRPGSAKSSEIRILFAFDPERQAIMLVAGDKAGQWKKWYTKNITIADELFDDHLDDLAQKGRD